jgi:hypothetical protein
VRARAWLDRWSDLRWPGIAVLGFAAGGLVFLPFPDPPMERIGCADVAEFEGERAVVVAQHLQFPPPCSADPNCRSGAQSLFCDGHEIVLFRSPMNAPFEPGPGPHALELTFPSIFPVAEEVCIGCADVPRLGYEAYVWRALSALVLVVVAGFFFAGRLGVAVYPTGRAYDHVRSAPAEARELGPSPPSVRLELPDGEIVPAPDGHATLRDAMLVPCAADAEPRLDLGSSGFRDRSRDLRFVGPGRVNGREVAAGAGHALDHGDVVTFGDISISVHAGERRLARYRVDGDAVRIFRARPPLAVDALNVAFLAACAFVAIRSAFAGLGFIEAPVYALVGYGGSRFLPWLRQRFVVRAARFVTPNRGPFTIEVKPDRGYVLSRRGRPIEEMLRGRDEAERALTDALRFEAEALLVDVERPPIKE